MDISSLLVLTHSMWAMISFIVAFIAGSVCFCRIKKKRYDDTFWFALALMLTWTGSGLYRVWVSMFKIGTINGDSVLWMSNHWCPLFLSLLVIAGGALHIRSLTKEKHGEILWVSSLAATCIASLGLVLLLT